MRSPLAHLVDTLLEISVVGSFTRLGILIRRPLLGWRPPPADALRGKTVLVTGPTSGLGREATATFAALGARIVLVGRDSERLAELRAQLEETHGEDRFSAVVADMSSLDSVADAVRQIRATETRLDVLVDNAGAMFPDRRGSPDGIEATLAVLAVGPFALVAGLLDLLRGTPGSRVIGMSSGGMYTQPVVLDDLAWSDRPFSGPRAYAMAKRIQVTLAREWARRLRGSGILFVTMHPGWADTPGLEASLPGFAGLVGPLLRTPDEGTDSLVWLATAPRSEVADLAGAFVHDRRRRPFDRIPGTRLDRDGRQRIWDAVVRLARVPDPAPRER